jgi:hypothetical protein
LPGSEGLLIIFPNKPESGAEIPNGSLSLPYDKASSPYGLNKLKGINNPSVSLTTSFVPTVIFSALILSLPLVISIYKLSEPISTPLFLSFLFI